MLRQDDAIVLLDRSVWATAAPLLNGSHLAPGDALGPYRIDGPLGAGGMGEVFEPPIPASTDRLPSISSRRILRSTDRCRPGSRAKRGRLPHSPTRILHVYDVGRHGQVDFLVMEYLEGETLAAQLARGPLPLERALHMRSRSPARSNTRIDMESSIAI